MLKVFYGRASQDLSSFMYSRISNSLESIESGASAAKQILLIVPAQYTLKAEEDALDSIGTDGFFKLKIVSENKLRQDILKETGALGRTVVNSLGRSMLLRKLIKDQASIMKSFGDIADRPEFVSLAGDFIAGLKQNFIGPSDIEDMISRSDRDSLLHAKLSDISGIYSAYEHILGEKYTDTEDLSSLISEKLKDSKSISGSEVWFYGFYSFTKPELMFLSEIAKYAVSLNIVLCMSRKEDPDAAAFAASRDFCRRLASVCPGAVFEHIDGFGYSRPRDLSHLEKNLFAEKPEAFSGVPEKIKLVRCSNAFSQAETIASEILSLVREKEYDFSDIAVLTEDLSGQGTVIKRVFDSLGIPVFRDEKRSVLHSPAAELLCALLKMCADGLLPSHVISFIKSGLVSLENDNAFEFETYVTRYHISRDRFEKPFRYGKKEYTPECFDALEKTRAQLAELLLPFISDFDAARTVRDKCVLLYGFLAEKLCLPDVLREKSEELETLGMIDASEECLQVLQSFVELTEQMVELTGDEEISSSDFEELVRSSLSEIKIGVLPQSEGKVLLGSVKRTKLDEVKAVFIAGLNDGILPSESVSASLLTEKELDALANNGYTVSKNYDVLRSEEDFLIYTAFSAPSDYLWLGYSLCGADEKDLKSSRLINNLEEIFPELKESADIENEGGDMPFILGEKLASARLSSALRTAVSGESGLSDELKESLNGLKDSKSPALCMMKSGLARTNHRNSLDAKTVSGLYKDASAGFRFSPSGLERFAACPFRHFVSRGLRPEEKRDFSISSAEIGDIYHECLMRFCRILSAPAKRCGFALTDPRSIWMSISRAEIEELVEKIIAEMSGESLDGLMNFGKAERYSSKRIRDVSVRFASTLVDQVRKGRLSSMQLEIPFGLGKSIPPLDVETPAGTVHIEGKIDRLDSFSSDEGNYVKIIDYKSGNRSFEREKIEKGLALQLMVYLESALGAYRDSKPAGVFYYNIKDPGIGASLADTASEAIAEDLAGKLSLAYKLDGVAVNDKEALLSIDRGFAEGISTVMGTKMNRQGEYDASKILSLEDFDRLRQSFRQSLAAVCEDLTSGIIDPSPEKAGPKGAACKYCEFGAVCAYDKSFEKN